VTGRHGRVAAIGALIAEPVDIRPVRPADLPAVHAFLVGLSLDSAYRRFFTGLGSPSTAFVRQFVEVDHDSRETLLALLGDEVVGMADCARQADRRTVELGVVVADGWQRRGLGPRLAREALDLAAARGATTLLVHALADNARVPRMLRRRWPDSPPASEHGTLVWYLPLLRRAARTAPACPTAATTAPAPPPADAAIA
jgi:ribosomal protein S18 acetylase RimI-like enzyme